MKSVDLVNLANTLFTQRSSLDSLWQEQADHFYIERADFTYKRWVGTDFAANLMTSYPLLARRELASQIQMMLRPADREWFYMAPEDEEREQEPEAKAWLEWANGVQRRAMYDRASLFYRAAVEADNDWSTFGQYVMSIRLNKNMDSLLYRLWHLRDCAWMEDEEGKVVFMARRWKPYVHDLWRWFGDKNHNQVNQTREKNPFEPVKCMHIVCEAQMHDEGNERGPPWMSLYVDCDHGNHEIERVQQHSREYIVPRWQTVSGSQYAYSPATVAALPDARLIQAMTSTLLEAGEKTTNPPLVATSDAVRSDVAIYAGGITWVDRDYDEKLGEALRPLTQKHDIPTGMELVQDVRAMIHQAFYLNKLTMPQRAPEMTAYEVGQRIQEYIRGALPLFAPMEEECNGAICDLTFDTLLRAGAFGSPFDMPRSLRGKDVKFKYRSPLHDAIEAQKAQTLREGGALLAEAAALDPTAGMMLDARVALREALEGIGLPQVWLRTDDEIEEKQAELEARQQTTELLAGLETASKTGENLAKTSAALGEAP